MPQDAKLTTVLATRRFHAELIHLSDNEYIAAFKERHPTFLMTVAEFEDYLKAKYPRAYETTAQIDARLRREQPELFCI